MPSRRQTGRKVLIVEIDGASTREEFLNFARVSRIPIGIRRAYLRFAMRTVVGVAPTREQLTSTIEQCGVSVDVARMADSPFHIAEITT